MRFSYLALCVTGLFLCAVSFSTSALSFIYLNPYYSDGGPWIRDQDYSDWAGTLYTTVTTLPQEGTREYLFTGSFMNAATSRAYGKRGNLPSDWDEVIHCTVAICDGFDPSALSFPDEENLETNPVDITGGFLVGVRMRPEEGHTWADIPLTYLKTDLGAVEYPDAGGGIIGVVGFVEPYVLVRARDVSYVDPVSGDNKTGDGSVDRPFADLLSGIGALWNGTVYLAPGTYTNGTYGDYAWRGGYVVTGKREVEITTSGRPTIGFLNVSENAILVLSDAEIPEGVTAYGDASLENVEIRKALICGSASSDSRVTVRDSALRNCTTYFLVNYGASVTLENVSILDGVFPNYMFLLNRNSELELVNVLAAGNEIPKSLALVAGGSDMLVRHSTFTDNTAAEGLFEVRDGSVVVQNSIFHANATASVSVGSVAPDVTFSVIEGGWPGAGNIDSDPLFVDPVSGDYHLLIGSPCVNAGSPAYATLLDLDGLARDELPDMGAYEMTSSLGDINGDGEVNVIDVRLCLQIAEGGLVPTPSQQEQADVNDDGVVDMNDARMLAEYAIGIRETLP